MTNWTMPERNIDSQGRDNKPPPLRGVRVLDLAAAAGQYCGKLLAQLGAEVIKVEPPVGDPGRQLGPFLGGIAHPERSLFWTYYNGNKHGITLNLDMAEGRELFKSLVAVSDVLVETGRPGAMAGKGLGYRDLKGINPRIIFTSLTPFGQNGPWRDFKSSDLVASALGGLLYVCGWPDRPPVRIAGDQAYYLASFNAALAILIALYHREFSGQGQLADISMHECIPPVLMSTIPSYLESGEISKRTGDERRLPANGIFPCLDGYVDIRLWGSTWDNFVAWLDAEGMAGELAEDKWKDPWYRVQPESVKVIDRVLANFTITRKKQHLYDEAVKRGLEVAPVNTVADIAVDRQLASKNVFVPVEHEYLATTSDYLRFSPILSESPPSPPRRAPLIGEHNVQVYQQELGITKREYSRLKRAGVI